MKFILINDIHLSHRGPQSRLDDWQEAIFGKLAQVAQVAVKVQAKAICIAGDIFHHKSRIAYGTVIRLMLWALDLRRHGIDVLVIPGNHDEVHDRLDSVESQPLGLLFTSGAFTNVSYHPVHYDYDDTGAGVTVIGVPYPDARDLANFQKAAAIKGQGRSILMAHWFATPQGGQYFGEAVHKYSDLMGLPFTVFHFGHDHSDHGVAQSETGQYFVNVGALSRGTLARDDLKRDVKMVLVDFGSPSSTSPVTVRQIKLKVAPVSEVFDLALKAQKDREHREVEAFVGQLHNDLTLAGPVSFADRLKTMELPDTIRTRVQSYLDAAETSLQEM